MFKKFSPGLIVLVLIIALMTLASSCGKKDDGTGKDSKPKSDLIKKDDKGEKADMKLAPKVGDKFRYKMSAKTVSTENSPATGNRDITSEQNMIYFYSQEVSEISSSGVITYKMKYDSIMIISKAASKDSSITQTYNSGVKDSVHSMPDFIQYNALIGEEFKLRVSPLGEIYDVYELEKIHDNIFKALGDTLSPQDKATIKESMGAEALKSIIQNQFQKFRGGDIYKDSSWTFSVETSLLVFPIKNILNYKVKEFQVKDGDVIAVIEANLGIDFISTEQKDKSGITVKINDSKTGGTGTILFNLTRGCIFKKETNTNIMVDMKMSARGQSAKSVQNLTTSLVVDML
ncbi:MAG: hypothetical protein HY959_05080 [Ignavibacteriae bacterium]|nr:hypothetical protein [Ignavibacteriota bacterium]